MDGRFADEVITLITPHQWHQIFDGTSISLVPSIGNWSLGCESHYWLHRGLTHLNPHERMVIDENERTPRSCRIPYQQAILHIDDNQWSASGANQRVRGSTV